MNRNCLFTALILATMLSSFCTPAIGDVLIEPFGTAVFVPEDDQEAAQMMLTNVGNTDIEFEIGFTYPDDEGQNLGPRRDDVGDRMDFFDYPNRGWCGLAYNGDEIVAADYDAQRIYFWNIEEEDFVEDFGTGYFPWGIAFDGENYWVGVDAPTRLYQIDRQGDLLNEIVLGFMPSGVAWDGENLWTYPYGGDNFLRRISPEGEELNRINCQNMPGIGCYALTWVPEHQDGQLWAISEASILIQFDVDLEENAIEVIQQSQFGGMGGTYGITHDCENLWISNYTGGNWDWGFYVIDDGIGEVSWLSFEPMEGLLEPDDERQIELTFDPAGLEAGIHHLILQLELIDARRETTELVEMSMVMSYMEEGATIAGNITDAETGEVVERCFVENNRYVMSRITDEEGEYDFEDLPLGEYQFTFTATDYLPVILGVEFDEPGEFIHDIDLLHAECNIEEEEITVELTPDEQTVVSFNVANDGNGPLNYSIYKRLLGDDAMDPWTFRLQYLAGETTGDSRIQGAVFVDPNFYIAGGGNNNPSIYVMNRDDEIIDQFAQAGDSRYGYKDLTYDGELIWGSGSVEIYGFRPDGELVRTIQAPCNPCNNLAWDTQRGIFWASGTTTNIFGIDIEGNVVSELDRGDLRTYGLAYWEDDPDGYNLYIFHRDNDIGDQIISKMNTDNGEIELIHVLEPEGGGTPISAFITRTFDIYNWAFISVSNNGADDRIDIWHVDSYVGWFVVEPEEGIIEAGEVEEFELAFDPTGLPPVSYEGELIFSHDGINEASYLAVILTVTDNEIEQQTLEFINGWTMVSSHVQPENPNIVDLCNDLVEQDLLLMVKNGAGNFYSPAFNFNNIQRWEVAEGYLFKTNAEVDLTLEGFAVPPDQPIPLTEGWHMIGYYPRVPIDAIEAMSGIVNDLELLKDGVGRFYSPGFNFSNMGDLQPGLGYLIKLSADVELVYPIEPEDEFNANQRNTEPEILSAHINTGSNMSLLIIDCEYLSFDNHEIGVYANGALVGTETISGNQCGIAIYGDDETTAEPDGAHKGDNLELRIFSPDGESSLDYETLTGQDIYETNGFWAIQLIETPSLPIEIELSGIYPNPFNSQTRISFSILSETDIKLSIYTLSGRLVNTLINGNISAGKHCIVWDSNGVASGVYLLRLNNQRHTRIHEVVLVR